jgi:hypothetical protein
VRLQKLEAIAGAELSAQQQSSSTSSTLTSMPAYDSVALAQLQDMYDEPATPL